MHSALINLEKTFAPSVLSKIEDALLEKHQIELWIKRDDLLHPIISGNKWRKLKYSLNHALDLGANTIVSMGGAYSNHLHALAYAGKELGLKTIGLIRGEPSTILTPSLLDMQHWGMELRFVSRSDYRLLRQYKQWNALPNLKTGQYWLSEGGAHTLALRGVAELLSEIDIPYDVLCVPCGTGTTLAGLVNGVTDDVSVLGFAALKNAGFLTADINTLLPHSRTNWQLLLDYHFGGFAKTNTELLSFMNDFEVKNQIPLDPVYTGKMLYALYDLIKKQSFKADQRIIAVHTGGLQGKRSLLIH
jgi:1-aminocyclopropane-1-carboxylate deaminase